MFSKSLLVMLPVFAAVLAPLFFHRSPSPSIGSYSGTYLVFLLAATGVALIVAVMVGVLSRRRGSMLPVLYTLFLLALLTLTLGIAEVALTWTLRGVDSFETYRAWGHRRSLLFGFEVKESHSWEIAEASYSTGPNGFRTHLGADWEGLTGPRIFTLGGSATFGYGLNDDQTWPHALEAELRAASSKQVSVINAGNNGFNSLQVVLKYYLRVAQHAPTHVLFYGGHNDLRPIVMPADGIWVTDEILYTSSIPQYWAAQTRQSTPYARSLVFFSLGTRWGWIEPADPRSMRGASGAAISLADFEPARAVANNARNYERNMRTLVALSLADGVTPVLATFVHALREKDWRLEGLRLHNEITREVARGEDVILIDLERRFQDLPDKQAYFFADRYHPNERGAAFIAAQMASALSAELAAEPSPRRSAMDREQ